MKRDNVPMLGCENALIAAGALMVAIKNEGTIKVTDVQVVEVLNRTKKQAIGGYCGLTGVCGIAPAIGACFSVILDAACPKDQETAMTMRVVARIVDVIANETGPCCCKNFVRKAIAEAVELARNYLKVSLPHPETDIVCVHVERHPHGCRKDKCSYFNEQSNTAAIAENGLFVMFDALVKKAIDLGAENAKTIDSSSVAVRDWVLLKCQYGCPFYDKDSLHPPLTPGTEETRKVLKEYDKALLLNGSSGPALSQLAIKIEHAAYEMGLYKAFALLSLPFGESSG